MVSYVAIPFQIYDLTGSNFAVGAVGLVELRAAGGVRACTAARSPTTSTAAACSSGRASARPELTAVLAVNAFRDEPSIRSSSGSPGC
jgi:hypothetical protein